MSSARRTWKPPAGQMESAVLKCGSDKVSKFTTEESTRKKKYISKVTGQEKEYKIPARTLYECLNPECGHQFSVTTGTLFNDSHLPLSKWFLAIGIMCNAKKSVSAKQMERDLGVNYRTAWYLNHRIRKAMDEGIEGMFTGKVEVDETYVGGRYDRRRKREAWGKQGVAGALQRSMDDQPSQVRVEKISTPSKAVLTGFVRRNVSTDAKILYTDEASPYKSLKSDYRHEIVTPQGHGIRAGRRAYAKHRELLEPIQTWRDRQLSQGFDEALGCVPRRILLPVQPSPQRRVVRPNDLELGDSRGYAVCAAYREDFRFGFRGRPLLGWVTISDFFSGGVARSFPSTASNRCFSTFMNHIPRILFQTYDTQSPKCTLA